MSEEIPKIRTLTTDETFNHLDKKLSEESRLIFSRFGDIDFIMMQQESIGKILGRSNKTFFDKTASRRNDRITSNRRRKLSKGPCIKHAI